jgi:hypothetical protein
MPRYQGVGNHEGTRRPRAQTAPPLRLAAADEDYGDATIAELLKMMVGATGIEPVTPTMST